ncbi:MAG: crotonase/enoyl-CoA hydratase family protein [Myxococcota bacterium]
MQVCVGDVLALRGGENVECFDLELKDHVAHLRLNRPQALNSMTPAFWRELPEIVSQLSDEGDARALVLSSTGKHFTAGMDLAVFQGEGGVASEGESRAASIEPGRARSLMRQSALVFQESFSALERARIPVLAAVQGGCIGGGVDLISACDARYCTADAFFCIQEINIGLTADVGTLQRLPRLVPEGIVRELAYTGRRLGAQRAQQVGLVNEVFPTHEALLAGVLQIAAEIAEKSPLAVWGSKEMLNYTRDHSIADGLNYIATWQAGMFFGGDMAEAFAAKQAGRKPKFQNLPKQRRGI